MFAQLALATTSGPWMVAKDGDPTCRAIFDRHYSRRHYRDGRRPKLFVGPGEKLVLRTASGDALAVWRKFIDDSSPRPAWWHQSGSVPQRGAAAVLRLDPRCGRAGQGQVACGCALHLRQREVDPLNEPRLLLLGGGLDTTSRHHQGGSPHAHLRVGLMRKVYPSMMVRCPQCDLVDGRPFHDGSGYRKMPEGFEGRTADMILWATDGMARCPDCGHHLNAQVGGWTKPVALGLPSLRGSVEGPTDDLVQPHMAWLVEGVLHRLGQAGAARQRPADRAGQPVRHLPGPHGTAPQTQRLHLAVADLRGGPRRAGKSWRAPAAGQTCEPPTRPATRSRKPGP